MQSATWYSGPVHKLRLVGLLIVGTPSCCYGRRASQDSTLLGYVPILVIVGIVWLLIPRHPNPEPEVPPVTATKAERDAQLVCPHCQTRGRVATRRVRLKKGVSGGKVVGAFLTSGLSLLAVGLSRKEDVTEAECSNCGSVWHF